jgi:hypothetical protein
MQMAGRAAQPVQTKAMARGHYLEPAIAAWFADQHPECRIVTTGTYSHRDDERLVASPDREKIDPDGNVELVQCKSAGDLEDWGPADSDDIPVGYRAQVIWELMVTGLQRCHVAVILPYLEFRPFVIEFDEAEAAYLRAQALEFMASIEEGRVPELDGHKATYEAVRRLHPDIADVKVDTPAELAVAFVEAVEACKAAESAKREASARLVDHMGSAKAAYHAGVCIARRQAKGDGVPYLVPAKNVNLTDVRSAA